MSANVAEVVWYNEDSASPMTVSRPSAFESDQKLIFVICQHANAGLADLTAPGDWTLLGSYNEQLFSQGKAWEHVYTGTEPSTWDFGYNSGADVCGVMFRITGSDNNVAAVLTSRHFTSNASSEDSPSVTPTNADDLLICTYANLCNGSALSETDPSGMTDQGQTQASSTFMALAGASQQLASASATGVRTWTSLSPTGQAGGTFSIAVPSASPLLLDPALRPPPVMLSPLLFEALLDAMQNRWEPPPPVPTGADVVATYWYYEDSVSPLTVSNPGGFASGELLVAIIAQHAGALSDLTAPSGWTEQGSVSSVAVIIGKVFTHVYTGTEPATWDFPYGSASDVVLGLFRVRGADTTPTVVVTSTLLAAVAASDDSPTLTPSGSNDLLICTLANLCTGTVLVERDPYGVSGPMIDLGQGQPRGSSMAMAAAKEQLLSGSATGVRTWTNVSPTGNAGFTFSVAIKSVAVGGGNPETGTTILGLLAIGAATKVAVQTGTCTAALRSSGAASNRTTTCAGTAELALRATGAATRTAKPAGTTELALRASGGATKLAKPAGTTELGLLATGAARKTALCAGTAELALVATGLETVSTARAQTGTCLLAVRSVGAAVRIALPAGRAEFALVATGAARRTALPAGRTVAALVATGLAAKKAPCAGTAALALTSRGSETTVTIRAQVGTSALALTARGAALHIAIGTGRSAFALSGTGTARRTALPTGRSLLALVARLSGVDSRAETGRTLLLLRARHGQCTTYRSFIGTTSRPATGTTAYALATSARPNTGTTARPNTGTTDTPC